MGPNRVPFDKTIEQMKAYGILQDDGTPANKPSQMIMEERRDAAREKSIESMIESLNMLESRCSRDEFVTFLRIGMQFMAVSIQETDHGIGTVRNMMLTPMREGAEKLLPGLLSAQSLLCARAEAISRKMVELGLDPAEPWRPSGEA